VPATGEENWRVSFEKITESPERFARFHWAAETSRSVPEEFAKHWSTCKVRKQMLATLWRGPVRTME
jgi:hypothetical protein